MNLLQLLCNLNLQVFALRVLQLIKFIFILNAPMCLFNLIVDIIKFVPCQLQFSF